MNAKDAIDLLDQCGSCDILHGNEELVLRALRLLAAAEANDGSIPEMTKAVQDGSGIELGCKFERERNGLAARVAELERAVDLAARAMAGEGVEDQGQAWDRCLRILDAARSQP